ncbi:MAG: VOC family protein [Hyphomicrobiaceae bacterium]|nr:VOC family protein [Hyphomicrobiaceae bacterium]MCC0024572.1 VOC family protein [Hyphomicrobiaceae bacterium]
MSALDHVGILVHDIDKSVEFYKATLGTVGIDLLMDFSHDGKRHAGFGVGQNPFFWLSGTTKTTGGNHVAFTARSRAEVDAFYSVAMSMGARDNGKPGLRPHYHANYYGAFVFDLDGNNIEAVCHAGE